MSPFQHPLPILPLPPDDTPVECRDHAVQSAGNAIQPGGGVLREVAVPSHIFRVQFFCGDTCGVDGAGGRHCRRIAGDPAGVPHPEKFFPDLYDGVLDGAALCGRDVGYVPRKSRPGLRSVEDPFDIAEKTVDVAAGDTEATCLVFVQREAFR